jgi:hypothetical protein
MLCKDADEDTSLVKNCTSNKAQKHQYTTKKCTTRSEQHSSYKVLRTAPFMEAHRQLGHRTGAARSAVPWKT